VNNSETINGTYSTQGKSENFIVVMEDITRTDQLGDDNIKMRLKNKVCGCGFGLNSSS
jgi:hypothetical protein